MGGRDPDRIADFAGPGIRTLVCDRQPVMREGLAAILGREPGISVAGAARSHDEAVTAARTRHPSVAVISHDPPDLDGFELTGQLGRLDGAVRPILLLDVPPIADSVTRFLRAGARAVLDKELAPVMLPATVRAVSSGGVVIAPPEAGRLVDQLEQHPVRTGQLDRLLSEREREVYRYVAQGLSNREIAEAMSLTVATVKSHVHSVARKLDVRDRVQAVILAYETGVIRPNGVRRSPKPNGVRQPLQGQR
ncbi:response regulator transcription factor [Kibdelosporangium persicum]|uniref:Response regulator transcription factor n=1 Tax=Kibdelosporangium persicum TaxID=2698649 RepID=A0ABX2FEZ6_9PSEU|nr:response regulator transcription factor [Kibdelosporangium persicum]NRN69391.1 Response regulator transcription factor [Kibdelosporangium persicum]